MPNAKDLTKSPDTSILLIGDGGTHKTYFLRTCPKPIYVFDFDNGMAINAGEDMEYDTYKELPKGVTPVKGGTLKMYEYGTAYPAFTQKLNEIGAMIDKGTCPYKTIGLDSLTMLGDIMQTYILKQNNRSEMQINDWGALLSNLSNLFGQFTAWPLVKVLTAHIKRDENQITGATEQLPLIPGQAAGKLPVYFDEVYFTEVIQKADKTTQWVLKTKATPTRRQAKSRKYNVPDDTPTDYSAILPYMEKR